MDHGGPGHKVPEGIGGVVLGSELYSGRESGYMLLVLRKLSEAGLEAMEPFLLWKRF